VVEGGGGQAVAEAPAPGAPPADADHAADGAAAADGADAANGGGGGGNGGGGGTSEAVSEKLNKLVKWIPGDVIALYGAAVTVFTVSSESKPSLILLGIAVVLSGLFVVAAAFAKAGTLAKGDLPGAAITAGAFAIWSITIPSSGWQQITWVSDHQAAAALIAAVVAAFYCFLAEGMTKRLAKK
jgi:hypothetical protein